MEFEDVLTTERQAIGTEEVAKVLSKIFPVLLEQADYEEVYSDTWWRKLKQGTGVKGVFWDPALRGGVGDIAIKSMDLLMLYWEPGVTDIQDSPNLFSLALANNDQLAAQWPQLEGHTGGSLTTSRYIHDESIDTSAVNDTFAAVSKFITLVKRDTSGMDEVELEKYHQKLMKAGMDVLEYGFELLGVPLGNAEKMRQAIMGYWEDAKRLKAGEKLSLNGLPASATGQYDRLYNAIQNGDSEEAAAARAKLEAMGKNDKTIYGELKTRLKKYDGTIQKAAKAQVAGDDATRQQLTRDMVLELYETLGIDRTDKADAAKREQVIDLVTGAITDVANAKLKGSRAGLYDDLSDALDSGRVKDVQDELNRLMTAGKKADSLRDKVTELVKPVYLAGNDHDREQMEAMLLKLKDDSGGKIYDRKAFEQWVKQAKKKEEQAAQTTDEWAGLR